MHQTRKRDKLVYLTVCQIALFKNIIYLVFPKPFASRKEKKWWLDKVTSKMERV